MENNEFDHLTVKDPSGGTVDAYCCDTPARNQLLNKAGKEGYFPDLHAGLADNMFGSTQTNDQFMFRPTAGIQDIESGEAPLGGGTISKVEGNTVVWNQYCRLGLVSNPHGLTITSNGKGGIHISGTVTDTPDASRLLIDDRRVTIKGDGRKYLCRITQNGNIPVYAGIAGFEDSETSFFITYTSSSDWKNYPFIRAFANEVFDIDLYMQLFDLTLMFGEGNEPSTVAEFESWLETNIGLKDYYPYNEGELIPVKDYKVKSVGFNAWDEEWEEGRFDDNTGEKIAGSNYRRSRNFIPVLSGYKYYFKCQNPLRLWIFFYDADKKFIGCYESPFANSYLTIPNNVCFIRFCNWYIAEKDYFKKGNICINLSYDDDKDGTYEPHWEHEAVIPTTKIYGKLNGSGDYVQVFPDGMKKAGSVADVLDLKNGSATRKLGSVDCGLLKWHWMEIYDIIYSVDDFGQKGLAHQNSTRYDSVREWTDFLQKDKVSIFIYSTLSDKTLNLKDSDISASDIDEQTGLVSKLDGVIMYFELDTPLTYTDLIIRDNGVDTPLSEISYKVDNYGTEEIILGNDTSVVSCTPTMTIKYGINATDALAELPHSYVSGTGNQNFSEEQKTTARNNIGAASIADLSSIIDAIKFNGHEYVDLGLPSGRLWAKCNIGASSETDYGLYFAWGSTKGYEGNAEHNFTYGQQTPYFIKENEDDGYGEYARYVDGETLAFGDDAARNNMGGNWRMPTQADFQELYDYCNTNGSVIWTTINGINGRKFTSPNGNYVFLPAAGYCDGTSRYSVSADGNYWSSACCADDGPGDSGYQLYFNSSSFDTESCNYRFFGFSVRAVQ